MRRRTNDSDSIVEKTNEEPAPLQAAMEENTEIVEPTDTIEVIDPVDQTPTIKEPTDENKN